MNIINIMNILNILSIINIMNVKNNIIVQIDFQTLICPARALLVSLVSCIIKFMVETDWHS